MYNGWLIWRPVERGRGPDYKRYNNFFFINYNDEFHLVGVNSYEAYEI